MFNDGRALSVAVYCVALVGALTAGTKTDDSLFQHLLLDRALAMAAEQNRVVFIDLYTTWCGACKKLDEDTWTDKKVIAILKKETIPLELNADRESAIREKYNIKAYPTLLILDVDGSVLNRVEGFQLPAQFIATLQRVLKEKKAHVHSGKTVAGAYKNAPREEGGEH